MGEDFSLIPGLPDDIAMECVVRIPCRFHFGLRAVCRRWRNLVTTPSFYHHRRRAGLGETLVCLVQAQVPAEDGDGGRTLQDGGDADIAGGGGKGPNQNRTPPVYGLSIYNATLDEWCRIHTAGAVPLFAQCAAVPSAGKFVLVGGWDPATLDSVTDVHVIDLVTGRWRKGKPMSAARSFFACAAVGPLVYVAGGHDNQKNALRSAEVYDPESDEWRQLPAMADERDECRGVACGGKFWVLSGYGTENQGRFDPGAECYDPVVGDWGKEEWRWGDDELSGGNPQHSSVVALPIGNTGDTRKTGEKLWYVDCSSGKRGVREYEEGEKRWKVVGTIPESLRSSSCAAVIDGVGCGGDKVFVVGSGGEQRHKAWMVEVGGKIWTQVETPANFSGYAFSAASFLL